MIAIAFLPTLLLALAPLPAASPRRIVSAAPSVTEMLYALGLGDRVVGVTTFCHYPPEARKIAKIGSYIQPNLETVLSLKPDLVVLLKEHGEVIARMERVGLRVLAVRHNDLQGVYDSLRAIGERAGVAESAQRVIADIQTQLEDIRRRAEGLPRRSVVFFVGRTPGTVQDLIAVGKGSFLNELIELAGGRNLFKAAATFYPNIPREEIYAGDPQVVIDMGDMSETDLVTEEHKRSVAELWRREFPKLAAVGAGRVYPVADDIFVVPGPRVAEAARALFQMIHPEAAR